MVLTVQAPPKPQECSTLTHFTVAQENQDAVVVPCRKDMSKYNITTGLWNIFGVLWFVLFVLSLETSHQRAASYSQSLGE